MPLHRIGRWLLWLFAGSLVLAVPVVIYHEFVFPPVHAEVCGGSTIYRISDTAPLPGYVHTPKHRNVVIFVHGIRDDARNCWTNPSGQYWPKLVANEQANWDVYVHQYQDRLPVPEVAVHMGVRLNKVFNDHDRVVVVAHSMGGLVIRQFLLQNLRFSPKVKALLLLATPSTGSYLANLVQRMGLGTDQVSDLTTLDINPFLRQQNEAWAKELRPSVRTICAYETRRTWFFEVVSAASANTLCDSNAVPIDAGHSAVAKPECGASDQNAMLDVELRSIEADSNTVPAASQTPFERAIKAADGGNVSDLDAAITAGHLHTL